MRNKIMFLSLLLVSLVFQQAIAAGGQESTPNATFAIENWQDLEQLLKTNSEVVLLDVRSEEEYVKGHIPGAEHVLHNEIAEQITSVDKDAPIVLYCQSGARAGIAFDTLVSLGYTNVVNFSALRYWEGELNYGLDP